MCGSPIRIAGWKTTVLFGGAITQVTPLFSPEERLLGEWGNKEALATEKPWQQGSLGSKEAPGSNEAQAPEKLGLKRSLGNKEA